MMSVQMDISINCLSHCFCSGATNFSQCSETDYENLIINGGGACLRNPPNGSNVIGVAECGNGRLEDGEQCDCGKPQVEYYYSIWYCAKVAFLLFCFQKWSWAIYFQAF